MESFRRDLRFALRTLLRSPGWTAATVLTLALGIGATTAIFSVLHGVLLRPLPYPEPDRIVMLWQLGQSGNQNNISDPNFFDLKEQSRSFSALAEVSGTGPVSVTGDVEPVRAPAVRISREFFDVLGVQPMVGRLFVEEELQQGGSPAVIVSERFWRDRLGARQDLTGTSLVIGQIALRVVGVAPRELDFPAGVDLWIPRELDPISTSRTGHNWRAIGRLREGVTFEQANREVSAIARRLKTELGDDTWMFDAELVPLREQLVGHVQNGLFILLGASVFLLLIAGANVTNLLLARAAARQRELAVRLAMGAGRRRLVQQFLVESFVVALAGGALGVLLAFVGVRALLALEPGNLPRVGEVGVSWIVLLFALGISLVTAATIGLITAVRGTGRELREALAQSQRTMAGGGGHRVRSGLVVAQVAATLVLLVGAGLLGRSFMRLLAIEPGYRTEDALVLDLAMPPAGSPEELGRRRRTIDDVIERLRAIPGVREVGGVNSLPLHGGGYSNGTFLVLHDPAEPMDVERFGELMKDPERTGYAEYRIASEGYFAAMDIPLVRGRLFEAGDAPDAPHVAVISEKLAQTEWPGEDAIGKYIQFGNMDGDLRPYRVVGIVGDIRERSLDAEPRATFYGYHRQRPRPLWSFNLVIRGAADPASFVAPARRIVQEVAPEVPPRFRLIEEIVTQSVADRRFSLLLLGVFAGSALLLAMMGVYSVISVLVAQREQEIGIRVALGAQSRDVAGLVLRQGTALALIGVVVGVAAALALTRLLDALLFGVSATDPLSFAAVSGLLVIVALVASWIPARRAARVDPITVLRNS